VLFSDNGSVAALPERADEMSVKGYSATVFNCINDGFSVHL
jgi:hypothetical protein